MFANGIYIGANFTPGPIMGFLEEIKQEIKRKIGDQVSLLEPHYEPHITIIYSNDEPEGKIDEKLFPETLDISPKSIDVFSYNYQDVNGSCLVLKVESSTASELNKNILSKHNLTPTFDKYTPHITLFLVNDMTCEDLKKICNNVINVKSAQLKCPVEYSVEELSN